MHNPKRMTYNWDSAVETSLELADPPRGSTVTDPSQPAAYDVKREIRRKNRPLQSRTSHTLFLNDTIPL